jgi:hypothetical protein
MARTVLCGTLAIGRHRQSGRPGRITSTERKAQVIMNPRLMLMRVVLAGSLVAGVAVTARAQAGAPTARELVEMSLEDLMRIEVTTASKKPETLSDAPAYWG